MVMFPLKMVIFHSYVRYIRWNGDGDEIWWDTQPVWLVVSNKDGGFKHGFDDFHIWDVIPTPLTNSIIFQDGYCTTNQWSILTHMRTMVMEYESQHLPEQNHPVL